GLTALTGLAGVALARRAVRAGRFAAALVVALAVTLVVFFAVFFAAVLVVVLAAALAVVLARALTVVFALGDLRRSCSATALPRSAGLLTVRTPARSSASYLSAAVPLPPATMAPAWPMRLPGGAVTPAM